MAPRARPDGLTVTAGELGWWGVLVAVLGGAIRLSTPYLFVSLGETLTEKSGRVNLGLEGTLVMGAMSGYAVSYLTGSPWLGVLVAGGAGALLGLVHGLVCGLPRVNDIAVGIALFIFGTGLAFYFGKPFIQPVAPRLPHLALGAWSGYPQIRVALEINALFVVGIVLAPLLAWALANTRWGLVVRTVGDNADAARALGYSVARVRTLTTMAGGFLAGVGGSFLSLYYPGTWNEGLSSGQGLMAIALVIFARWQPVHCFWVSLLFGGATALGPALQSVGITANYYLLNAAPYVLTLVLLIVSSSPRHTLAGAPRELSLSR
jgi:simple sugar transport system permease protein